MRRASIAALATLLIGLSAAVAEAGNAKTDPRWSEAGRRHVLALTDQLEKHPLAADAKKISTEVMQWWTDVPDLTIHVCAGPFLDGKNEKIKPILVLQTMFGAGALLIQSGDKQPSETDVMDPKRLKSYLDQKLAGCRKTDQKNASK
jgi:hypothetical protein